MFFSYSTTLSDLAKTIRLHIQRYEATKWFWQSNSIVINQIKTLLPSSDKTVLTDHQLWTLFEALRSYTDDEQDPETNQVILKIKKSFPYFQRLTNLDGIDYFKDRLSDIIANSRQRSVIIHVLEELEKLDLLSNNAIRAFAVAESEISANIVIIFGDELDEKLFAQLIKLHNYGAYLFETELRILATHPHREALFTTLAQFHNHHALPRDRRVFSNIIAHDETGDMTIITKMLEKYGMINQPLLDLCGIISSDKREGMLYVIHSMHESETTLTDTYFLNVTKILAALLSLDIFTHENIDRALKYANNDKLANAFNHLDKFAINLKTAFKALSITQPQYYFDTIATHPYPEEIAYCLATWRDGRSKEGLDICLSVTNFYMIRLLMRFIDSSTLNTDTLNGLMQLGRIYAEHDLQEIAEAFDGLYNYMLSKEIWCDQGRYFMQLCAKAEENPKAGKEELLAYTKSIQRKDHLEREQRLTRLFSTPNTAIRDIVPPAIIPSQSYQG